MSESLPFFMRLLIAAGIYTQILSLTKIFPLKPFISDVMVKIDMIPWIYSITDSTQGAWYCSEWSALQHIPKFSKGLYMGSAPRLVLIKGSIVCFMNYHAP